MPKGNINKSQAIREVLEQHPNVPAKEVVDLLAQKGIQVNQGLVYMVKGRLAQMKSHKRQKAARLAQASRQAGIADPIHLILKVKELAQEAGGMGNLQALIQALAD